MQHFASGKRYAAGFPACSRRKKSQESAAVPNESFSMSAYVGIAGAFKRRTVRIMKLTAVLLTLAFLQVQANGLGQEVTLDVKGEKLEKVLSLIEKQTGYVFFTTADLLKKARPVTLQVRNEALSRALDLCFKGQVLDYVIDGKTISVVERKINNTPTQNIPTPAEEVKVDVTGRVVNENGESVPGATVMVKGSTQATATNEKGEFRLENVDDKSVLVISGINIETYEVRVRGRENLAIKVQTRVSMSEAVTITMNTGYQEIPKERATGSFATVNKELLDQRVAPDIISKLEGITSGLVFNKDAGTGENKLRIRGESTIFGKSDPLIVLNGFPYEGDLSNINPNDIESVNVLKDAAAASIWGVQAGNGVIVLTTKKGKYNQRLKVGFNSNVSIAEKPDLFYTPQISPSDYIDFEKVLFQNGYYDGTGVFVDPTMPAISPVVEILDKQRNGEISAGEAEAQINKLRNYDLRNDLLSNLYRRSIQQQYAINISGGSSKASYYFSGGYDENKANVIGNSDNRITLNTLFTFAPINGLEIKSGLIYTEALRKTNGISMVPKALPYTRLVDDNGFPLSVAQRRSTFEDTIANHGFVDWKYRPVEERNYTDKKSRTVDTRLFASIKYSITKDLNVDFNYQYTRSILTDRFLINKNSYFIRDNLNKFAQITNGNYTGSNFPDGGILDLTTASIAGHNGRINVNYNHTWDDHSISSLVGFEAREVQRESNSSRLYGYDDENGSFINPNLFQLYDVFPFGGTNVLGGNGSAYSGNIDRFRSYYGNLAYTFLQRYTVSASARLDGSNYFGVKANQKSVPLWSTGIKWDIDKERFFKSRQIDALSLRLTYGYNGNLDKNTAAIITFQYLSNNAITGFPFARINNIPNKELGWERLSHLNLGIDFGLRNNWLSGSLEAFLKRGTDLIGDALLDPTTGVIQLRGNYSAMQTKGIDIQLNAKLLDRSIKWTSNFLFTYAADKVTRYDVPTEAGKYINAYSQIVPIVDKPLYSLSSLRWGGLDPLTGAPKGYLQDTLSMDYDAILNKTPIEGLVYHGRYNPPIYGSLTNTVSWKNLSFTFNITYKLGYYFRRSSLDYGNLINNWQNGHSDYAKRWQKPGDENTTTVPSFIYPLVSGSDNFYTNSSILVERGDHIRLQYATLNYSLDKALIKNLPVQNISVYLYANNLNVMLWRANDKGIDPDYPYINYPPARSWSAGIRATF
jgi:TonB-linked SusC/RagA family outer membrane protein